MKQAAMQAASILIKILSLAKPPTPAQPLPLSTGGQGAGLHLMKRKQFLSCPVLGGRVTASSLWGGWQGMGVTEEQVLCGQLLPEPRLWSWGKAEQLPARR